MEGLKEKIKEVKALMRKCNTTEREYIEQFLPDMVGRYYCIKAKDSEGGDVAYFKVLSTELDDIDIFIAVEGVNFDIREGSLYSICHIESQDTYGLEGLLDFVEITKEEFEEKYAVWTKVVEMKKELGISID